MGEGWMDEMVVGWSSCGRGKCVWEGEGCGCGWHTACLHVRFRSALGNKQVGGGGRVLRVTEDGLVVGEAAEMGWKEARDRAPLGLALLAFAEQCGVNMRARCGGSAQAGWGWVELELGMRGCWAELFCARPKLGLR